MRHGRTFPIKPHLARPIVGPAPVVLFSPKAYIVRTPNSTQRARRHPYKTHIAFSIGGAALAAGTASFVSSSPTAISVTATNATGGSTPYTYQWQRNANGGSYSNLSGATSLSLTDSTAVAGTLYGYKLVYTDNASGTVTSNAVTAQIYTGGALTSGGGFFFGGLTGGFDG